MEKSNDNSPRNNFIKKSKFSEHKLSAGTFMGDENMADMLNKLIGDHKSLFKQYRTYVIESDKLFAKYVLMVEALKQEHDTLKKLLPCESSDLMISKRKKKNIKDLSVLLEEEACLLKDISDTLEKIQRLQLTVNEKEKVLVMKKVDLGDLLDVAVSRCRRMRQLQELEDRKYDRSVQYNSVLNENKKLRKKIDEIKVTRDAYGTSYTNVLRQIEMTKLKKKFLLEEVQQFIEEKDSTVTMFNAILSGSKKEDDLYQQKIESMKQMIRNDTKTLDFLVKKLNERTDLKAVEAEQRLEELRETLEEEGKLLSFQQEALEAIQDLTEEKEGYMMVHTYNQKEADKMALFNYIADLNGELTHLKQKHASLLKDIDALKADDVATKENYTMEMKKNEKKYSDLMREMEKCNEESCRTNTTIETIKQFIECTFKRLGCDMGAMEKKLGLDVDINPNNMTVFLSEIEVDVAKLIHSYNYGLRLKSLTNYEHLKDEAGKAVIRETMKTFESVIPYVDEAENFKSVEVPHSALAIPTKDEFASNMESSASDLTITRARTKAEFEEAAKKLIASRSASNAKRRSKFIK
ncbi:hypothetical protein HELRODRAFT_163446 [Helobdella robusta]|uniref:ODAD1 central coiled coil region domain-containing protein n=1 Tax=Helobdella robusta TaxID=6412 RepID=T1EU22_HELRO|nr:hypothetical protein HELRODRAFT_163446 [Helobdella robusta]ESN96387.1 hypothetical protein HELRODRAFT_163446 [Helobdella robusta]